MNTKDLDIEEMKRLYDEGFSVRTIAERFSIDRTTVYNKLKKHGIERNRVIKKDINIQEIKDLYNKGFTVESIAEKFNVDRTTIYNRLKEYNIEVKGRIRKDIDQAKIIKLYNQGFSSIKIAKYFKANKSAILKRLKDNDIELRKQDVTSANHGLSRTRLYKIWQGIKERCFNENSHNYARYGANGRTMCDEWKADFQGFYEWSMKNGYSDELTIDRINNEGIYEPSNCKWSTPKEQQNNKSNNTFITINGITKTIANWSDETGIARSTLQNRIKKGLKNEDLLKSPRNKFNNKRREDNDK